VGPVESVTTGPRPLEITVPPGTMAAATVEMVVATRDLAGCVGQLHTAILHNSH
jgi:hypothetical protein